MRDHRVSNPFEAYRILRNLEREACGHCRLTRPRVEHRWPVPVPWSDQLPLSCHRLLTAVQSMATVTLMPTLTIALAYLGRARPA